MLGLSTKIYPKAFDLTATLDPRVIFIISTIILNLHDSSLSGVAAIPNSRALDVGLAARSCHKSMIIK